MMLILLETTRAESVWWKEYGS